MRYRPLLQSIITILIFAKGNAGGTDKVGFYNMKADGFSLDDKRSPISDNDIPNVVVARFHNPKGDALHTRKEQSSFVPIEDDYNLYQYIQRGEVQEDCLQLCRYHSYTSWDIRGRVS